MTTPLGREKSVRGRLVSELVTSKPQKVVYEPATTRTGSEEPAPSRVARSPGDWRTVTEADGLPFRRLVKEPE